MSAKHTPGEWTISNEHGSVGAIRSAFGFVAFPCAPRVIGDERKPGESWLDMMSRTEPLREAAKREQEANARLIAAAPDLLEACNLGDCLSNDGPTLLRHAASLLKDFAPVTAAELCRKADAEQVAIAKAKGGQP